MKDMVEIKLFGMDMTSLWPWSKIHVPDEEDATSH